MDGLVDMSTLEDFAVREGLTLALETSSVFTSCNFLFESRGSNFEAHSLANFFLTLAPGHHVWSARRMITTGISHFTVCHGGRQRHERRMAKAFAVRRGRQKAPAK